MREKCFILSIIILLLTLIFAYDGGEMCEAKVSYGTIREIPDSTWQKLEKIKIYFGHQSVGNNILDGIKDLLKETQQIKLNIVETRSPYDFNVPLFAHSKIGKNEDPESKIDDFAGLIGNGLGDKVDIAFLKFCFVDIESGTDVNSLFAKYADTMARLKKENPKAVFVHLTVPLLRKNKPSIKDRIKALMGKKGGFFDNQHNLARNEFNELVVKEYNGKEPVFDLAKIESTYPDGRRETFTADGRIYYSLVPEYTKDGGHLNEIGRKKVAEQLLIFIANIF